MPLKLLAIDLGKRSFHICGIDSEGVIVSRKISRSKLIETVTVARNRTSLVVFRRDDAACAPLIQLAAQPIIIEGLVAEKSVECDVLNQGRPRFVCRWTWRRSLTTISGSRISGLFPLLDGYDEPEIRHSSTRHCHRPRSENENIS